MQDRVTSQTQLFKSGPAGKSAKSHMEQALVMLSASAHHRRRQPPQPEKFQLSVSQRMCGMQSSLASGHLERAWRYAFMLYVFCVYSAVSHLAHTCCLPAEVASA